MPTTIGRGYVKATYAHAEPGERKPRNPGTPTRRGRVRPARHQRVSPRPARCAEPRAPVKARVPKRDRADARHRCHDRAPRVRPGVPRALRATRAREPAPAALPALARW